MAWWHLHRWIRRRRDEVDAELESHLRMAIADRVARGESPDEARAAAHRELGNVVRIREESRDVWTWVAVEHAWHDLKLGARVLTRAPAFSATAVLLIALVVGGNTAIFTAVHGMLTKPAPGVTATNLVSRWIAGQNPVDPGLSYPNFLDLSAQSKTMTVIGTRIEQITVAHPDGTVAARGASVTERYFDVLGLAVAPGRAITAADYAADSPRIAAVISHGFWQTQFQGRPDVIGQPIALNGHQAAVVGVMPQMFQGAALADATDIWVPLEPFNRVERRDASLRDRQQINIHHTVAALIPPATVAQARAEAALITQRMNTHLPADAPRAISVVEPYSGTAATGTLFAQQAPRFLAVFSVVTLVTLLVVCANVANLMLARSVARQREMAVRQSFGASRARIVRIVLAESLTVAIAAWLVAALLAYWLSQITPSVLSPAANGNAPVNADFTPDWIVLGYAMALAIIAAVVFSAAPVVRTWKQDLVGFLKPGDRGVVHGRSRLSRVLVVTQLAFSVLLLMSAGLGWRSLGLMEQLHQRDVADVLLVTVDTRTASATAAANQQLLSQMLDAVRAVPGVTRAAYARQPPQTGWPRIGARLSPQADAIVVERNIVTDDYFAIMHIAPVAGRLSRRDGELLERTLLLGTERRPVTVVGLTEDAYVGGFRETRPRIVFASAEQDPIEPGHATFYVRHAGPLAAVTPVIRVALQQVRADVPVTNVRTVATEFEGITWHVRLLTTLLGLFAAGALLIAAIGQYAAMAFTMRRRERDFSVRVALGAASSSILWSAMKEGLILTAAGLALGATLGALAGASARGLLYGVTPTDPITYIAVVVVLGVVSLAACYLPARRVSMVSPLDALRTE